MGFKLSLLMALEIVLVLKDNFPPKKENHDSCIDKKEHILRILFISLLMREPGGDITIQREAHIYME